MKSKELIKDIKNFIEENYIDDNYSNIRFSTVLSSSSMMNIKFDEEALIESRIGSSLDESIEDIEKELDLIDEGFVNTLLKYIDESGMTDSECYNKAQINRSHFWKMKNDPNYHIQKNAVISLILALELGMNQAQELLMKAGYALSNSSKMDLIIKYCIEHKIYNIVDVNEILFEFDQELLGAGIR